MITCWDNNYNCQQLVNTSTLASKVKSWRWQAKHVYCITVRCCSRKDTNGNGTAAEQCSHKQVSSPQHLHGFRSVQVKFFHLLDEMLVRWWHLREFFFHVHTGHLFLTARHFGRLLTGVVFVQSQKRHEDMTRRWIDTPHICFYVHQDASGWPPVWDLFTSPDIDIRQYLYFKYFIP